MDNEKIKTEGTGEEQVQTPTPETSSNPNEEVVSMIQRFIPDADVSTPDAIINSCLQLLKSFVPLHDKIFDLAKTNPETAATLSDWIDTGNLVKAIARNFSDEEKSALIEELEDDSYEEDRKVYSERTKAVSEWESNIDKNMKDSQIGAQEFVDELKLSEEQVNEFLPFADRFINDVKDHKLTKANWLIIWNAYRHDSDVAEAEENGQIAGRNEKIVAEKKSRKDLQSILPEATASSDIKPQADKKKSFASEWLADI